MTKGSITSKTNLNNQFFHCSFDFAFSIGGEVWSPHPNQIHSWTWVSIWATKKNRCIFHYTGCSVFTRNPYFIVIELIPMYLGSIQSGTCTINNQRPFFITHIKFQGSSGHSPRDQGKLAPVLLFKACWATTGVFNQWFPVAPKDMLIEVGAFHPFFWGSKDRKKHVWKPPTWQFFMTFDA